MQLNRGFTYIELLIAVVIGGILILGLSGLVGTALRTQDAVHQKTDLARQAADAMQRMVRAVSHSRLLLLPLNDNPATNWPEHIREETVPASAPIGDSTKATAVLAVTLPSYADLDGDGIPDADNDRDGLVDEDVPDDMQADVASGIYLIDDDGDGYVDEASINPGDDDEVSAISGDDPFNGIDDDGDGSVDEDAPSDANDDGCAGTCGLDDDGDGQVDEGSGSDDDEDGSADEDWYDPVVFYLYQGKLWERTPVPWDETGIGGISGRDFVTSEVADHVTRFRVERIARTNERHQLVDLTLELTAPDSGEVISLNTQVRVGGAL